jgi:hypothetical protein
MVFRKIGLFLLAAAFFCLFGGSAFSQVLDNAYVKDALTQEWPIVVLAPEGNKFLIGDRLVILVNLENHGRIATEINRKILKLVFYVQGEGDNDWKIVEAKQEKFLELPAVLKSGQAAFFARVVFDTNRLKVKGRFKIYAEIFGMNIKSSPLTLEVQEPV